MSFISRRIFFAILITTSLASCSKDGRCLKGNNNVVTENRPVDYFEGVFAEGDIEVYITEDSIQNIKIEAESNIIPLIKTNVRGGQLHIYTSDCIRKMKGIKVWLNVKNMNTISLDGSGLVQTMNTLHGDVFTVKLAGSGTADLKADMKDNYFSIDGSGKITITGVGTNSDYSLNGSGKIYAFEFPVSTAKAKINGSGYLEINASDSLDVDINGSGNVYYKGTPRISVHTLGSGQVIPK